ncbi:hypothetical protein Peur_073880 [Populus x canadensis]
MGMVPILRASISRSLPIHVPNISLSNPNSIPKKNELLCSFIRNQNNSAAVKPERELSKFAPSKSLVSVTCTLKSLREVGMMHSLFTTTMGELLLLLTVSLGCELTTYILPLAEDQTGETRREQEKTLES